MTRAKEIASKLTLLLERTIADAKREARREALKEAADVAKTFFEDTRGTWFSSDIADAISAIAARDDKETK